MAAPTNPRHLLDANFWMQFARCATVASRAKEAFFPRLVWATPGLLHATDGTATILAAVPSIRFTCAFPATLAAMKIAAATLSLGPERATLLWESRQTRWALPVTADTPPNWPKSTTLTPLDPASLDALLAAECYTVEGDASGRALWGVHWLPTGAICATDSVAGYFHTNENSPPATPLYLPATFVRALADSDPDEDVTTRFGMTGGRWWRVTPDLAYGVAAPVDPGPSTLPDLIGDMARQALDALSATTRPAKGVALGRCTSAHVTDWLTSLKEARKLLNPTDVYLHWKTPTGPLRLEAFDATGNTYIRDLPIKLGIGALPVRMYVKAHLLEQALDTHAHAGKPMGWRIANDDYPMLPAAFASPFAGTVILARSTPLKENEP